LTGDDGQLGTTRPQRRGSGVVATAHLDGGPTTQTAVLWRQKVPIARLLMSFLETRAMNQRFHEAEVVLIAEPGNRAF
jgi:hypothetical protein